MFGLSSKIRTCVVLIPNQARGLYAILRQYGSGVYIAEPHEPGPTPENPLIIGGAQEIRTLISLLARQVASR